ncbi:DNA helicase [Pontibacillus halophilus JSM 076056 = DSM 19796]|uniref:DNA helicase n=1 Tax=Pontibacillus halophilus JSM 076056 = DSM 19796 TaxID=1385510 RepID=A0A0A5I4G1_9BACI|nr:RNA polymerase recycling motor HelD [Pontibacillus halophilus]KGX90712.1 DNA helicase [Pontibacillus halophilus JSM 076056 = DSM 19796]
MKNHPDYQQELERLTFTTTYMDSVIAAQELDQESMQKRQEQQVASLDFKDSSLKYQDMLTHANFMKMSKEQLENLKKLRKKPYFARINFQRKDRPSETFYIGKVSLFDRETQSPIILDWRSPLANVYYEGRLGEVSYEAHGETYEGHVSLKRQYTIEESELIDFRDIDLTTKDEMLQQSLDKNADHRLSEIVATIQEEQNEVIRANLRKPIVVQGAAGSGKTTIALHRVSYFLYTMRDVFQPEEMLILAPNRLFIDYMKEVLPELGVEKSHQTTFTDFVQKVTNHSFSIRNQHDLLTSILEGSGNGIELQIAEWKGSKRFKELMDQYIISLKQSFLVEEDVYIGEFRIKQGKKLKQLFLEEYAYMPFYKRKEKIRQLLMHEVRNKKKIILQKVAKKYDDELDRALYGIKDAEKRRRRVSFLMDQKEQKLVDLEREAKSAVSRYMRLYPNKKLTAYYKGLFESEVYTEHTTLSLQEKERFRMYMKGRFKKHELDADDLGALLYLQTHLYGIDPDYKAKKVVIDEAQDYSYMEFASLKRALNTELFTIVGDLAQGIYHYRGLKEWTPLLEDLFTQPSYQTLQKTYRTTVEIMTLANDVLAQMNANLPQAEPVVRHGSIPSFLSLEPGYEAKMEAEWNSLKQEGFKSIAIIGKTLEECRFVYTHLTEELGDKFQLIEGNEVIDPNAIAIMPVYLSKGLEFDVVWLLSINESYEATELDEKLLYVAMTRPLHKLYLVGATLESFMLNHVHQDHYTHFTPR